MKCSRKACDTRPAICWHRDLHQHYCVPCARKINEAAEHSDYIKKPLIRIPENAEVVQRAYRMGIWTEEQIDQALTEQKLPELIASIHDHIQERAERILREVAEEDDVLKRALEE